MSRASRVGRILVSNDDGINAAGLKLMERVAEELSDDVWVVAPEFEQSGASHSLTLHDPLRLRAIGDRKFAVRGTPTDCVMMGVKHILKDRPPDLVLSGVNRGSNLAEDVTYSGTIAAAMEGTVLGIPSVALSQAFGYRANSDVRWSCAEEHAANVLRHLLDVGWPREVLININFPDIAADSVKGVRVTSQGRRDQSNVQVDARVDARGVDYFWLGFRRHMKDPQPGSDIHAIENGYISVSPLHLDLTHGPSQNQIEEAFQAFRIEAGETDQGAA